jgi:nucleoside diphosphate-linked moiety X motif 19, mitochondrial
MAKYWREASTLILAVRPRSSVLHATSTGNRSAHVNDFKILMLQRTAKSNFMPAKLVFPGGMISEADHADEWEKLYKNFAGCTLEEIYQTLNSAQSKVPLIREKRSWKVGADIAFRIGAIRETFEESGLLIATNREQLQKQSLNLGNIPAYRSSSSLTITDQSWRKKVQNNPFEFLNMCNELQLVPDIWSLTTWRNWLTPVMLKVTAPPKKPRRFDTLFYMCCFDVDELPDAIVDDTETTQAQVVIISL